MTAPIDTKSFLTLSEICLSVYQLIIVLHYTDMYFLFQKAFLHLFKCMSHLLNIYQYQAMC